MDPNQMPQPEQQGITVKDIAKGTGTAMMYGTGYTFLSQFAGGPFRMPVIGLGRTGFVTNEATWTGVMGLRTLAMGEQATRKSSLVLGLMRRFGGEEIASKGLLGHFVNPESRIGRLLGGYKKPLWGRKALEIQFKKLYTKASLDALRQPSVKVISGLSGKEAAELAKMYSGSFRGGFFGFRGKLEQELVKRGIDVGSEGAKKAIGSIAGKVMIARAITAFNVAGNVYYATKIGSWAVKQTISAMGNIANNTIRALGAFNRLDYKVGAPDAGNPAPYLTAGAATERQRAQMFIQQSHGVTQQLGARASVFGNEAEYAHYGG